MAPLVRAVFLLVAWPSSAASEPASEGSREAAAPTVHAPGLGLVTGFRHHGTGVRVFAGLRYAAAPTGDLRWRPPQPAAPEPSGSVDAAAFGPACPQTSGGGVLGSEDCLTLNVYAPPEDAQRRPVLVWVHGGSYIKGTADIGLNGTWGPLYDGTNLAARGAVVVTVQYRLGVLGFLGSKALNERDPKASSGNYGLLDQRMALRWVKEHIGAFGGDPERVLLFGQSAGAGSVEFHLVSKGSRGLFAAAALQSGADAYWNAQSWPSAESGFGSLLKKTDCAEVACLLRLPVDTLLKASGDLFFAATVDGMELQDYPWRLMQKGHVQQVPVIVGFTRDEAAGGSRKLNTTEAEFDALLESQKVPHGMRPRVKAEYTALYTQWYWAAQHFEADYSVACPARRFARAAAAAGLPVFAYKFSRLPSFPVSLMYGAGCTDSTPQSAWGAYHGAELPFVFADLEVPVWKVRLSDSERQLAQAVSGKWLAMASTGRPSPAWPAYLGADGRRQWALLDSLVQVAVPEEHLFPNCDIVDRLGSLEDESSDASPLVV